MVSGDQLGAIEWGYIASAVKGHPNLQDLADFKWSRSVLEPGVTEIKLQSMAVGAIGAVVLSHLLQRNVGTTKALHLRLYPGSLNMQYTFCASVPLNCVPFSLLRTSQS